MYEYDFKQIGSAIKTERKKAGITRERLAEQINISPRYLISIENDGQAPSFQILYDLVRIFNISVDQYILKAPCSSSSTIRNNVIALLSELNDNDLIIVENTIHGIMKSKETEI